jgi:mannosylglucosylglycerate synthase
MARIAFIQNKLKLTDGVSLEVDKWRAVLEALGHEVLYIAGNEIDGVIRIPELFLKHPETNAILRAGTVRFEPGAGYPDEAALIAHIDDVAVRIEAQLIRLIRSHRIDVLVPNNLLSVGYNIPAIPALCATLLKTGLPAIVHSHDFYFENSGEVTATCPGVLDIYDRLAPPRLPRVAHVVINRLAQAEVRRRKGIEAEVVPNVFDFAQPAWTQDDYNRDFRASFGIGPRDIVFLQATRILDRKGVELAIDTVAAVQQRRARLEGTPLHDGRRFGPGDRIVLLCAGYVEQFGISGGYHQHLIDHARDSGVDLRFVGDRIGHARATAADGSKIYSLWDSYVWADAVTYPSVWEGWGNQFIEAVFARLPVLIFEYPVWTSDLGQAGFDVVSLGDRVAGRDARGLVQAPAPRVAAAADALITLLQDAAARRRVTDRNFQVGERYYSYRQLSGIVSGLLARIGVA